MDSPESNPYQVKAAGLDVGLEGISDETLRNRYIFEEVRIMAVGWFYYCMAAFQIGLLVGLFVFPVWKDLNSLYVITGILIITSVIYAFIGYGLRHFLGWARLPSKVAAVVGMIMVPVGTFAGIYCLYLLSKSSSVELFDPRYQSIVAKDKYKKFGWLSVLVGLLFAVTFWAFFLMIDWQTIDLGNILLAK